jgi:hypothetical protein
MDLASRAANFRVTSVYAKPSWGWVLGTGTGVLREAQGSPREVEASPQIY